MHELEADDVISGGRHKFQIVRKLGEPGGQCIGYQAKIIGSASSPKFAFIKLYHDLNLSQMGRLDLFFQEILKRIPPADLMRLCLPLDDSNVQGRYQPAIGEAGNTIFIAYRWIEGMTLLNWIKQGPHSDDEKKRIILAVLYVCRTLSRAKIVHLDLKPENLLINVDHSLEYVTLIDMDMARIRDQNGTYSGVREIGGTLCYAAPEQHEGDDAMISEKCDVFSLSIILSILLLEYHPFFTSTDCFQDAKNGVFTLPDRGYHSNIISILKKSLHPKPDLRPAIAQILATFRRYAATSFRYQRCGIIISCGDYEYTYWNDTVLANQDLRGFGITLPSQGGLRLLIDQKKGEYGVQALNGNIPITFNNRDLQSGKPFWMDKKNNNLSVCGKKLSLQLVEE